MMTIRIGKSFNARRMPLLMVTGLVPLAGVMAVGLLDVPRLRAQSPAAAAPAFEVASVKPNKGAGNGVSIGFAPGGRFNATNVTLRILVAAAYGTPQPLPNFQVLGGPNWLDSDRFDVIAKAEGDPQLGPAGPPPQMVQMIRALLADRFKLVAHNETRELPIYALVMARSDGRLGPQLHVSADTAATAGRGPAWRVTAAANGWSVDLHGAPGAARTEARFAAGTG